MASQLVKFKTIEFDGLVCYLDMGGRVNHSLQTTVTREKLVPFQRPVQVEGSREPEMRQPSVNDSSPENVEPPAKPSCPADEGVAERWPRDYVAPLTSPFYARVISPFCDMLVANDFIPLWVTPNQLSFAGLVCGLAAAVCAQLRLYILVAPLWWGYGLLDNLDGKHARKTNRSSFGGDFVDHAVDSIITSLTVLVTLALLVPEGTAPGIAVLLTVFGQLPFYLGCWAHYVLGRVLLGTQVSGGDFFTVDELNFIVIPVMVFIRLAFPRCFDTVVFRFPFLVLTGHKSANSDPGAVTIGIVLVFGLILFSFISSLVVIFRVYQRRVLGLLLPGLAFAGLALSSRPPLLLMIPCFSLLSFELIGHRLHLPNSCEVRLWLPVLLFGVVCSTSRMMSVGVTWGLSNPVTAVAAIVLSTFTLSLLIQYKNAINRASCARASQASSNS